MVTLLRYLPGAALYICGGALILSGGMAVLVEFLLNLTFGLARDVPLVLLPAGGGGGAGGHAAGHRHVQAPAAQPAP